MKRFFLIISILALSLPSWGQEAPITVPRGYVLVDSLVFTPLAAVDTTLDGRSIFNALPDNVALFQSGMVRNAVETRVIENRSRMFNGYRIRIFFDNSQNARSASSAALYRFKMLNPEVSAYRTFANPYFKVTVGDYRSKSEAMAALATIKKQFPTAFIVKEKFRFPSIENASAFKVDTLKVLRKID